MIGSQHRLVARHGRVAVSARDRSLATRELRASSCIASAPVCSDFLSSSPFPSSGTRKLARSTRKFHRGSSGQMRDNRWVLGWTIKTHTPTIYHGQVSNQEGRRSWPWRYARVSRSGHARGRGWVLHGGCGDRVWETAIRCHIEFQGWHIENHTWATSPRRGTVGEVAPAVYYKSEQSCAGPTGVCNKPNVKIRPLRSFSVVNIMQNESLHTITKNTWRLH